MNAQQREGPSATYIPLPEEIQNYIRLVDVLKLANMGHTKFYRLVSERKMPQSIRLYKYCYWRADNLREALEKLQNEATNKSLKGDV